ncbi:Putative lysine-specific demethylase JMJ16 [Linum perenne]
MRTKRAARKRGSLNHFPLQPGVTVVSRTSFKLRKVQSNEQRLSSLSSLTDRKASSVIDHAMLKSLLTRRPWILHGQNDGDQMQEESDSEPVDKEEHTSKPCLPKGVARGCPDCRDCLKEFKDTLKYITSVHLKAKPYGICRIVPPPSWHPPCMISEKSMWEESIFESRIQRIDGLLDQSLGDISKCSGMEDFEPQPGPRFSLKSFKKYSDDFVSQYFGIDEVLNSNAGSNMHLKQSEPSLEDIEDEYRRIIESPTEEMEVICSDNLDSQVCSGFPSRNQSSENSSGQDYVNSGWNLKNTAVLPDSLLSFESPSTSGLLQPRLRIGMCFSSLPWQKNSEHHLYSLSYMHVGSPKIWYAVPGSHGSMFEATIKNYNAGLGMKYSKTRHYRQLLKLTSTMLKSEGVPVFRCIQYPGEFVLVLPRSHYSSFDSGFSCGESINFAPLEWLPDGQNVVELYSEQARKTSLSQDKLLVGAAREVVRAQWLNLLSKNSQANRKWKDAAGKDGILAKALNSRIKLEASRRKYLCNSSQSSKMDKDFDATSKKECEICYYDLHLSAASCSCSADRYSCLNHAKQLCSCPWSRRLFMYRYEIDELRVLLEAVGGKPTAIYKWARDDLKLLLHSLVSDNSSQTPKQADNPKCSLGESKEEWKEKLYDLYGGRSSTTSDIKEELKARMLQRKSLNEKKLMQGKTSISTPTTTSHSSSAANYTYTEHVPEVSSDSSSESNS